jgi:uncharacterized membrane protein YhaH (DUF805 family)
MPMSQLLFSFQGRLNRQPYWLTSIAIVVLIILLIAFALAMFGVHDFWAGGTTLALLVILYIPLLWVGLALGAKRLHDRDKSAWWLLLFYLVPSLLSGAANRIDGGGFILHLAGFAITVWAFVELGCLRGTVGPNRYGPDPLAAPATAPV